MAPSPVHSRLLQRALSHTSAPTWEAAAALKAFSTTSVTRWLVSTFPPTTAASGEGDSRQPVGAQPNQPFFSFFMSCSRGLESQQSKTGRS